MPAGTRAGLLAAKWIQLVLLVTAFCRPIMMRNCETALSSFSWRSFALFRAEAERSQLASVRSRRAEALIVAVAKGHHQLGRNFLRRDHLPAVDAAVFVVVEAPTRAADVQPAMVVGLAVEVVVDVAVGLDAVLEVAPAIDDVVFVRVDKLAKHLAVGIAHDPAGLGVDFLGLDRAFGGILLGRHVVGDIFLYGTEPERLGSRRRLSKRYGGPSKAGNQRKDGKLADRMTSRHRQVSSISRQASVTDFELCMAACILRRRDRCIPSSVRSDGNISRSLTIITAGQGGMTQRFVANPYSR